MDRCDPGVCVGETEDVPPGGGPKREKLEARAAVKARQLAPAAVLTNAAVVRKAAQPAAQLLLSKPLLTLTRGGHVPSDSEWMEGRLNMQLQLGMLTKGSERMRLRSVEKQCRSNTGSRMQNGEELELCQC